MGWIKAVGRALLWVVKNPTVREIAVTAATEAILRKRNDKTTRIAYEAEIASKRAEHEFNAAPKVSVIR
jgi:hypothetical protein